MDIVEALILVMDLASESIPFSIDESDNRLVNEVARHHVALDMVRSHVLTLRGRGGQSENFRLIA